MNLNAPDDDEEEISPSSPSLAPDQKQSLYDAILAKYSAAADTSDVDRAQKRARATQIGNAIGSIFADSGSNVLRARGVNPGSTDAFFDRLQAGADKNLATARAARKDRMDQALTEDRLDQELKDRSRRDDQVGRESDPNSLESKTAQALAKKLMPSQDFSGMSASQLKGALPSLEKIYTAEQQRLGRIDAINARNADRAATEAARKDAKEEDRAWKEEQVAKANQEKKKATLTEIENRRMNIVQNLDILDKMIKEDGTFELVGSHNQDLDRLVDSIATDMAKLQDPDSVARPSEVDAVKRNLIQSGIFTNRNATARQILANFKNEVDSRAASAYSVRGLADMDPRRKTSNIAEEGPRPGFGQAGAAPGGKTLVRKQYSKARNQTKLIYSDGTEEIVDGQK